MQKGTAAYAVSKAAVVQSNQGSCTIELAFKGVRVNAIAPGWFVTEINENISKASPARIETPRSPTGRFRQDGDLDGALLLLASDAGSYITGVIRA